MSNNLKTPLTLQMLWLCLATGYNLLSIYFLAMGESPLIQSQPQQLLMMLSLYLIAILFGYSRRLYPYIVLSILLLIGLFFKGVLSHLYAGLIENDFSRYSSLYAWGIAIVINIFGLVAFTLGIFKAKALLKNS